MSFLVIVVKMLVNTDNEKSKIGKKGNSLGVRWLGLCTFTAEGPGLTPDLGTKIPQAVQHAVKQNKKKLKRRRKDYHNSRGYRYASKRLK